MRAGLLAILCLTACNDVAGFQFVIDPTADTTADEIRVYVGVGPGTMLHLAPEGYYPSERKGLHLDQDVPYAVDTKDITSAKRYRFVFTATADVDMISVIAVGFTGGIATSFATKFDLPMQRDHVEVWELALEPADPAKPGSDSVRQIQVWGAAQGDATCVHTVDPGASHEIAYIVGSDDDKDCDGFTPGTHECDDLWHGARFEPSTTSLDCMEEIPVMRTDGSVVDVCSMGGRMCRDGVAGNETCGHMPRFCAAGHLCQACPQPDVRDRFQCALEQYSSIPTATCTIALTLSASGVTLCTSTLRLSAGPFTGCKTEPATYHGSRSGDRWTSRYQVGGVAFDFGSAVDPSCTLDVPITPLPNQAIDPDLLATGGLLAVMLANDRGIVVPIAMTPQFFSESACSLQKISAPCTISTPYPFDDCANVLFSSP